MKLLSFLFRSYRRAIVAAVVTGALSGLASTALLALIARSLAGPPSLATSLAAGFGLLCLFKLATGLVSAVLLVRLSQQAIYDIRMTLCRRILAAPLRQLEQLGGPRMLAVLTDDVSTIAATAANIPALSIHVAVVISCFIYLGWLSVPVLCMVLVALALGVGTYHFLMTAAMRYMRQAREESDVVFRHLRALLEGAKELKLHRQRRHAFATALLEPSASALQTRNVAGMTLFIAAGNWGNLLFFAFIGLLLFLLPSYGAISQPTLSGYTIALLYMMGPIEAVLNTLPSLGRAGIALAKIESLGLSLETASTEPVSPSAEHEHRPWQRIELRGVTHSYLSEGGRDTFLLGPLDLVLTPGELLFVVGGNGSGKTTLAKVLAGLYAPQSGEVLVDGECVTDSSRELYRQRFSAIFSDFFLFEELLGLEQNNIDTRAREYLETLQLDGAVDVEAGHLSTTELSRGQRKRLALLTAYLENRPIYVFDEWAADQDPHFKAMFYTQLLPELKSQGKTVVVITHDDSYYHLADRTIKLDYGKVVYDSASPLAHDRRTAPEAHA